MVNATLIVFMIVSIVLLFTAMVLSAMASSDAQKGGDTCKKGCHKYSMWSALVTGIAVAVIGIVMVYYIYSSKKEIATAAMQYTAALHGAIGGMAGVQGQPLMSGSPQVVGSVFPQTVPSASQVMASLGGTA